MSDDKKIALITGASSGIGWETALLLAARGWKLAVAARRQKRLEALAERLRKDHGTEILVLAHDVSRPEGAREMVVKAAAHFGRLDILVNNAGILRMAAFGGMPVEEMREIFETNFWGVVQTLRAALPIFEKQGGGHVVNVGSAVSRRALPFMAAYAASKFALGALTESLRVELAEKGVTLTSVFPGGVETEMPRNLDRSRLPENYPDHGSSRITAVRAAQAVVKAVEKRPVEIYVPWWLRPLAWASVMFPGLTDRLIRRSYGAMEWK